MLPSSATLRYQLQLRYATSTNFRYSTLYNFSYFTLPTSATQRYKSFNERIFLCVFVIKIPHAGKYFSLFLLLLWQQEKNKEQSCIERLFSLYKFPN